MTRRQLPRMLVRASQAAEGPIDRFMDALDESCRQTARDRAADRVRRGLATCGHIREDGLGICAAGLEEWMHQPGPQGHTFTPILPVEVKADGSSS